MGRDSRSRSRKKDRSRGRKKVSRSRSRSGGRGGRSRGRGQVKDYDDKPCSLIVRNLSDKTTPDSLKEAFREFGDVKDSYIPLDYHTRTPKGFGFIQFGSGRETERAMEEMNEQKIDGAEVTVSYAKHGRRSPNAMKDRERGGDRGGGRKDSRRR